MSFIQPKGMGALMSLTWANCMATIRKLYDDLEAVSPDQATKAKRTFARACLPQATETKLAITGNARAWREFISKRAIAAADPEIRALAVEIHRVLNEESPLLFGDIKCE
jgi:thymidylate synthase ThyX